MDLASSLIDSLLVDSDIENKIISFLTKNPESATITISIHVFQSDAFIDYHKSFNQILPHLIRMEKKKIVILVPKNERIRAITPLYWSLAN